MKNYGKPNTHRLYMKQRDDYIMVSYCGLTLLLVMTKLYKALLSYRISEWAEQHPVLSLLKLYLRNMENVFILKT